MSASKSISEAVIKEIDKKEFFINGVGPYKILSDDSIAENCKIALYKANAYSEAHALFIEAADKFNIRKGVLTELIKSLDDSDPNWYYDEVMSMFVPYDFFMLNRGSISINL